MAIIAPKYNIKTGHFRDDKVTIIHRPGLERRIEISMKVLVRNGDTGLFLMGKRLWTFEAGEAQDFLSCSNAVEQMRAMALTNAELILSFGDPRLDIRISSHHTRLLQSAGGQWV